MAHIIRILAVVALLLLARLVSCHPASPITIDGDMTDWDAISAVVYDASGDISKPGTDVLEFKVAHDQDHLYVYSRHSGAIVSEDAGTGGQGRYYYLVFIDLDNHPATGFDPQTTDPECYSPVSLGNDFEFIFERDWNDTSGAYDLQYFYGNGGVGTEAVSEAEILDGTMKLGPGSYDQKATFKFINDQIPGGIILTDDIRRVDYQPGDDIYMLHAFSPDLTECELSVAFAAALTNETGTANLALGQTITLGIACESSPWSPCGDGVDPLEGYLLEPPSTPTPTPTSTGTHTPSPTSTHTPTHTSTPTVTASFTSMPTATPSPTECVFPGCVWVDFAATGNPVGTQTDPVATLAQAIDLVETGGTIWIEGGSSQTSTGDTPRITKPLRLKTTGGLIRIGDLAEKRRLEVQAPPLPDPSPGPTQDPPGRFDAPDLLDWIVSTDKSAEHRRDLLGIALRWYSSNPVP